MQHLRGVVYGHGDGGIHIQEVCGADPVFGIIETVRGIEPINFDAAQNINGGAQYLKQMLDTFDGDVRKAVAAYNAGPEAVKEYGGVPPYSETQQYVSSVLDLYR